jgi:hypothetical protein
MSGSTQNLNRYTHTSQSYGEAEVDLKDTEYAILKCGQA